MNLNELTVFLEDVPQHLTASNGAPWLGPLRRQRSAHS